MARARKNPTTLNMRPVWADVSLPALIHNFESIRAYVNPGSEKRRTPRQVLCIVKGNGYGHGGPPVSKALEKAGADWFGVTCTEEGIALREAGVRKPILILTSFVPGRRLEDDAVDRGLDVLQSRRHAVIDQDAVLRDAALILETLQHRAQQVKLAQHRRELGVLPSEAER